MFAGVVVTTALLLASLPNSRGKIRHFPRQEERPVGSGDNVATALGKVSIALSQ